MLSVPRFMNERTGLQRPQGNGVRWLQPGETKTEALWVDPHLEELCPRNSWGQENLFLIRTQPMEGLWNVELLIPKCFKFSMCMCVWCVCAWYMYVVSSVCVWCICVLCDMCTCSVYKWYICVLCVYCMVLVCGVYICGVWMVCVW